MTWIRMEFICMVAPSHLLIAALRAENAWLRRELALRLFPPATSPPFDPEEFQLTTWDDIEAGLKTLEQNWRNGQELRN